MTGKEMQDKTNKKTSSNGKTRGFSITEDDLYLFNEGSHTQLYNKLGSHVVEIDGVQGTSFAVWAPNAKKVFIAGSFNDWNNKSHELHMQGQSGIWYNFFPGIKAGELYKYHIISRFQGYEVDKSDPFSNFNEVPPKTASIVWNLDYQWADEKWMQERPENNSLKKPIAIYEVHLGSWMRKQDDGNRSFSYREIAPMLVDHMERYGFTHIELLPVMDHPFFGSWGYQVTGYFAPSGFYGTPQDLMYMVDYMHQHGIGVILDWVPSHFPTDEHGLGFFDGTHLFEHSDPRNGFHPDWNSFIFNYGRHEVRSFLLSSAMFWLDKYHADGLRVDGVASMLYLDYSRKEGEWIPNKFGGRENIEAISFLKRLNEEVYKSYPDVQTIAEESTAWPMVSRPTYLGGLGFGMKWDMGWMHDMLDYMSKDPVHRKYHHDKLTFRMLYAFTENFLLSLSHDEVVHGKGSLLNKMPGDDWQKFANLRLLFSYMFAQPGKKLLFMGGEFGQWSEWNHDGGLDWHLLAYKPHLGIQNTLYDLIRLYRSEPALYQHDFESSGFEWMDCNDSENSVISFLRKGKSEQDTVLAIFNFTPVVRTNYRSGVPGPGFWKEIFNSDAVHYYGSGQGNMGGIEAFPLKFHGRTHSINLTLPPLGSLFLKRES